MPPEAFAEPMSENLTPQEAARALTKAHSWEAALATRTAGLTWMVWGTVTPAVFLTYAFLGVLSGVAGADFPWYVWNLVWVPWIAGGVLMTAALWRTAGLAVPDLDTPRDRRRSMIGGIGASAVLFLAFLFLDPDSAILPLGAIGAVWLLMASVNVWNADREGCIVGMLVGGVLLASAVAMALLRVPVEVSGTVSILVSGLVPFAAGIWHLVRG